MGGQRDVDFAPSITQYGFDSFLTNFEGMGAKLLGVAHLRDKKNPHKLKKKKLWESAEILGAPFTWVPRHQVTSGFVKETINHIKKAQTEQKTFLRKRMAR